MKRKGRLILILGIVLFILRIALGPTIAESKEVVVKFGQSFTVWEYEALRYKPVEKVTQFRVTFDQLLFEGERVFDNYSTPPPGKKYVKITFTFENLGPRPGAKAPQIDAELKTGKGHIYPEQVFYYSKIQKPADPGEKGNGQLIFLIPVNDSPQEVIGKIFGSFPYSEEKATRFRLLLPKDAHSPPKLRGNYQPTIGAQSEIELIDHYLTPGKSPQVYVEYKNIGKRDLRVFLGIFWFDSNFNKRGQLDERGPIPSGEKEKLVYTLQSGPTPEKITSYILQIATKSSQAEEGLSPPFWNPSVFPVVKPTRVIETPTYSTEFASVEVANLSSKELSSLGKGINEVIRQEMSHGGLRRTLRVRAQVFADEAVLIADIFPDNLRGTGRRGIESIAGRSLAWVDQRFKNLESILNREFPDVGYDMRPPKKMIIYKLEEKIVKDAIVALAEAHLNITVPLWAKPLEKMIEWGIDRLTLTALEKCVMKELGYGRIKKPKIGVMTLCYDKKTKMAWVNIDLEDLPEKYGWKNEGLYMSIHFTPEPPDLGKIKDGYAYRVVSRGEPTRTAKPPARPATARAQPAKAPAPASAPSPPPPHPQESKGFSQPTIEKPSPAHARPQTVDDAVIASLVMELKECKRVGQNVDCNLVITNNYKASGLLRFYLGHPMKSTHLYDDSGKQYIAYDVAINGSMDELFNHIGRHISERCIWYRLDPGKSARVSFKFANVSPLASEVGLKVKVGDEDSPVFGFKGIPLTKSSDITAKEEAKPAETPVEASPRPQPSDRPAESPAPPAPSPPAPFPKPSKIIDEIFKIIKEREK